MRDHRPAGDLLCRRRRNAAEEEIGDVALENNDFAIVRQDAGEHSDCALQDGNHGEHGRNTESDARDTDERADAMTAQIGHDQLEKDHACAPTVISAAFSVTRTSSSSKSLQSFPRNDNPSLDFKSKRSVPSPNWMNRRSRSTAPGIPIADATLGRSSRMSRAIVFPRFHACYRADPSGHRPSDKRGPSTGQFSPVTESLAQKRRQYGR